jgi:hypothetical protein
MSLLTIAQTVALRFGLAAPNTVASSTDQNILQIVGMINEDGQELASRHSWQALTNEATFATVATEIQGTMTTLTGLDFAYVVNETMWNRTQRRPVFGPKTPAEWQQLKAQVLVGPWQQYRVVGGKVKFTPAPPAGQSVFFEWCSKNWAIDINSLGKNVMTVDTDTSLLDERLLTLGAIWRFKAAKKLEHTEDFEKYDLAVLDAISRDVPKARLDFGGASTGYYYPATLVPAGGWN